MVELWVTTKHCRGQTGELVHDEMGVLVINFVHSFRGILRLLGQMNKLERLDEISSDDRRCDVTGDINPHVLLFVSAVGI